MIPLHFSHVVVYHFISSFLDPSLKTARGVVPGLVFITTYGMTLILCPLNMWNNYLFIYLFILSMRSLSQFLQQSCSSFPSTRNINTRSLFYITLEYRNSPLLAQSQCHVIANEHKWCPVLNRFEKFRLLHPFHGLMEGHTCALPCRQMFVKDFHESQSGLVVN